MTTERNSIIIVKLRPIARIFLPVIRAIVKLEHVNEYEDTRCHSNSILRRYSDCTLKWYSSLYHSDCTPSGTVPYIILIVPRRGTARLQGKSVRILNGKLRC